MLRVASLLRLLLLDSLTDRVNREFRRKIRFRIGAVIGPETDNQGRIPATAIQYATVADAFDPEAAPGLEMLTRPRDVTKYELLSSVIMVTAGLHVSVKDLIKHLAHIHGLMHSDDPRSAADEALMHFRRKLRVGGTPAGLREIRAVGRVVSRALTPLRTDVLTKYGGEAA